MAPGDLEQVLKSLPSDKWAAGRLLTGSSDNEDAAVLVVPSGKAIVQTVDFFTPIVNDPYKFGQIAAANSLSDVYAMGGEPWCAMNIVCFPGKSGRLDVLEGILRGGADKTAEAGAALAGGHSVEDSEVKFGLSVTGLVDPHSFARNRGLTPGLCLIATKALGTGILATAIKGEWEGADELEEILFQSAGRLNKYPGQLIARLKLKAATDITGFGLGGHLLEMLEASGVAALLHAGAVNILPQALDLADQGLVPAGSVANRQHRQADFAADPQVDPLLVDLIFDAQTSGGMILAVPPALVAEAMSFLLDKGEIAAVIGETLPYAADAPRLRIMP
jgi:selenide,water dikinase